IETGPSATVFSAPQQVYTQKLVAASRFDMRPLARPPIGETLLEVDGITRDYHQGGALFWTDKPLRAVDAARFSIARSECLALVGPSGCGKTTLAKIIVGLDRATA